MILVWCRKAIAESSRTQRSCRETEEPVNDWLYPKFGNFHSLQLSRDLQLFLFFINYGYAHVSLLCFPLVMLSASHWLLAQAPFCRHTHLPLSPNSTTSTVQVIYRYLQPDAPVFSINRIHSTCGHGEISQSPCWYYPWANAAVSTSSDTQHLWTWWHFGDHIGLINLSVNNIRRIHTCRSYYKTWTKISREALENMLELYAILLIALLNMAQKANDNVLIFLLGVWIVIGSANGEGGCLRGKMVKAMDCGIVVSEFELQPRYYVHFRANTLGEGMNPLILPAMG